MINNRVYKFHGNDDEVLVYAPSTRQVGIVSKYAASEMPDIIAYDREDQAQTCSSSYPPRFNKLTFYLSDKCNMDCAYCYAESNAASTVLSNKKIETAIEYLCKTSLSDEVTIRLLGGEPTVVWDALEYVVSCARSTAAKYDKAIKLTMESNGLWSDEQYAFIVSHFDHVGISIDGPKDIHDYNRRLISGGGSFERVYRTLRRLHEERRLSFNIACVITSYSVHRMIEITRFFCENFPGEDISFTPMDEIGERAKGGKSRAPNVVAYLEEYVAAVKYAHSLGTGNDLMTSVIYFDDLNTALYCDCNGGNYFVLPTGHISSCTKVNKPSSDARDMFIYGMVDDTNVTFSKEKYEKLREYNPMNIAKCSNCFAINICRAGCPLLKLSDDGIGWNEPLDHCEAIKQAILDYLWHVAAMNGSGAEGDNG